MRGPAVVFEVLRWTPGTPAVVSLGVFSEREIAQRAVDDQADSTSYYHVEERLLDVVQAPGSRALRLLTAA